MKKFIVICLLSVFCVMPFSAKAATVEELNSQLQATLLQLIDLLTQQIKVLQMQLADMLIAQQSQTAVIQQQAENLQWLQTSQLGSETVVVPEVKKELTISVSTGNTCHNFCEVDVQYWENGIKKSNNAITVSANNGEFLGSDCSGGEAANSDGTQRKGNPITCPTSKWLGYAGFDFFPTILGTTTITATIDGASKTITIISR